MKRTVPLWLSCLLLALPCLLPLHAQTAAPTLLTTPGQPHVTPPVLVGASLKRLTLTGSPNLSGTTGTRAIGIPGGVVPNATVSGGEILGQTVTVQPDGSSLVVYQLHLANDQGGKLTLTVPGIAPISFFDTGIKDFSYPAGASKFYADTLANAFTAGTGSLRFRNTLGNVTHYTIRDNAGVIVQQGTSPAGATTVDLSGLKPGAYTIWARGAAVQAQYGDVLAATAFGIVPPLPAGVNYPALPAVGSHQVPANLFTEDAGLQGWAQFSMVRVPIFGLSTYQAELARVFTYLAEGQGFYATGQNGASTDPVRGRPLLLAFPSYQNTPAWNAAVTDCARQYRAQFPAADLWVEGANEPNVGASWVPSAKAFFEASRAGSATVKVMGPGGVSILGGLKEFLAAGGGAYIDGYSGHPYNAVLGDYDMGDRTFAQLRATLAQYGYGSIPLFLTEQGYATALAGVVTPGRAARWYLAQLMTSEANGIPVQHQYYWVAKNGNEYDTRLLNYDGSGNPPLFIGRQWSVETWGMAFASQYDFGAAGSIWYGLRFNGAGAKAGKALSVFAGKGTRGEVLRLSVTGPNVPASLPFDDAWGNTVSRPVVSGVVTSPPSDGLCFYVPHDSSLTLVPLDTNWGTNWARQPGVIVTVPSNTATAKKLNDGLIQNGYDGWSGYGWPYGTDSLYPSRPLQKLGPLKGDTKFPVSIQFNLGQVRPVSSVLIESPPSWQNTSNIVSATVWTCSTGQPWVLRKTINQPPNTVEDFADGTTYAAHAFDYYNGASKIRAVFPAVSAQYVRVLISQTTNGGQGDLLANRYGGQPGPPQVTLSEIEIDGPAQTARVFTTRRHSFRTRAVREARVR